MVKNMALYVKVSVVVLTLIVLGVGWLLHNITWSYILTIPISLLMIAATVVVFKLGPEKDNLEALASKYKSELKK